MSYRASLRVLLVVVAAAVAAVIALPPIHQDAGYHTFADGRPLAGIPNALNVLSNLPFLLVGLIGLRRASRPSPSSAPPDVIQTWALRVLFAGIALVGVGSSYFHLAPSDSRLFWDRAPMAIVFTTVLALVIGRWISAALGARLFVPLLIAGVASVLVWRQTGDLRVYVLVQFLPMVLVPLILILFRARNPGWRPIATGVALYAAAKGFELLDARIYSWGHLASGHTLKHLVAAAAIWCVAAALLPGPPAATRGPAGP